MNVSAVPRDLQLSICSLSPHITPAAAVRARRLIRLSHSQLRAEEGPNGVGNWSAFWTWFPSR